MTVLNWLQTNKLSEDSIWAAFQQLQTKKMTWHFRFLAVKGYNDNDERNMVKTILKTDYHQNLNRM